jgi:hypothetical protein
MHRRLALRLEEAVAGLVIVEGLQSLPDPVEVSGQAGGFVAQLL